MVLGDTPEPAYDPNQWREPIGTVKLKPGEDPRELTLEINGKEHRLKQIIDKEKTAQRLEKDPTAQPVYQDWHYGPANFDVHSGTKVHVLTNGSPDERELLRDARLVQEALLPVLNDPNSKLFGLVGAYKTANPQAWESEINYETLVNPGILPRPSGPGAKLFTIYARTGADAAEIQKEIDRVLTDNHLTLPSPPANGIQTIISGTSNRVGLTQDGFKSTEVQIGDTLQKVPQVHPENVLAFRKQLGLSDGTALTEHHLRLIAELNGLPPGRLVLSSDGDIGIAVPAKPIPQYVEQGEVYVLEKDRELVRSLAHVRSDAGAIEISASPGREQIPANAPQEHDTKLKVVSPDTATISDLDSTISTRNSVTAEPSDIETPKTVQTAERIVLSINNGIRPSQLTPRTYVIPGTDKVFAVEFADGKIARRNDDGIWTESYPQSHKRAGDSKLLHDGEYKVVGDKVVRELRSEITEFLPDGSHIVRANKKAFRIHGDVSDDFVATVEKAYLEIPLHLREYAAKGGDTINLTRTMTEYSPDLAEFIDEYYGNGQFVKAILNAETRESIIPEYLTTREGDLVKNLDVASVTVHEFAHGLDLRRRVSFEDPEFLAAFEADEHLRGFIPEAELQKISYFETPIEALAQLSAIALNRGAVRERDKLLVKRYRNLYLLVHKKLHDEEEWY